MNRTFYEMVQSAMEVRQSMLAKGQDPTTGKFFCTDVEKFMILDQPQFMNPSLTVERDRLCGLKIELIDTSVPLSTT